jgi:hypothetical protein
VRSIDPSSRDGVPTQMNVISVSRTAAVRSEVVDEALPVLLDQVIERGLIDR